MKPGPLAAANRLWPLRWNRSVSALLCVCAVSLALTADATIVGSTHDFVDNGFQGGGACGACHVPHNAGDERLWPRLGDTGTYPDTTVRLCMDCHASSTSDLATIFGGETAWEDVTTGNNPGGGVVPLGLPTAHQNDLPTYADCTGCHRHAPPAGCPTCDPFEADTTDCSFCHNATYFSDGLNVDIQFDDVWTSRDAIWSQHNVRYNGTGDLSTKANNECRKCHGVPGDLIGGGPATVPNHPNNNAFLVSADNSQAFVDIRDLDDLPFFAQNNYAYYDAFCLSCHDGIGLTAEYQLMGVLGTNQVGPTDRSDPASQQSATPWLVPPVPQGAPAVAYFGFYNGNGNGHGALAPPAASGVVALACMGGAATAVSAGCHEPHGSTSRFLIDDAKFTPGQVSANDVATSLCYSPLGACHDGGDLSSPGTLWEQVGTRFHSWLGTDAVLHDDSMLGVGIDTDGMTQWRIYQNDKNFPGDDDQAMMDIWANTATAGTLPFYTANDGTGAIHDRGFPATLTPAATHRWVMCLTCHDPHGTDVTTTSAGMLRQNWVDGGYSDPICGQCHIEATSP